MDSASHSSTGEATSPPIFAAIFIFNLIVGTGALTMPKAFAQAGWLISSFVVILLAFMSFMSVTFIVESMSIANFKEKKERRHQTPVVSGATDTDETTGVDVGNDNETTSLLRDNDTTSKWYDITIQKQLLDMAKEFLPSAGLKFASITLSIYLYGDLVIYSAAISKSMRDVTCSHSNDSSSPLDTCWILPNDFVVSRSFSYRIYVAAVLLILGPFAYFDVNKTIPIQIVTSLCRWVAFITMIILTTILLTRGQGKGSPPPAAITGVPNLFGVCVYSFMCHHSLPLLITPIRKKEKYLYSVIISDYSLILLFYLLLSYTAIFTFDDLQQIYTLNFQENSSTMEIITSQSLRIVLQIFLPLFPVFTLSFSFPIIAISLQKNLSLILRPRLISMLSSDNSGQEAANLIQVSSATDDDDSVSVSPRYHRLIDRFILPTLSIFPPVLIALITEDLTFWVNLVGSYAGVAVQYMTPALIIFYAREKHKPQTPFEEFNNSTACIRDKLKSPFTHKAWIFLIAAWAVIIWILVTVDYILKALPSQ